MYHILSKHPEEIGTKDVDDPTVEEIMTKSVSDTSIYTLSNSLLSANKSKMSNKTF